MAQADVKTAEIGGETYKVYMLDPFVASDLLADLVAIIAPAAAALKGGADGEELDGLLGEAGTGSDGFERAATLFFAKFTKEKQREIIKTLSKVTVIVKGDAEPKLDEIFSVHFRGRLALMYQWLGFALKSQFSDFFVELLPAIKAAVRKLARGA